jgi:hypothetical protein
MQSGFEASFLQCFPFLSPSEVYAYSSASNTRFTIFLVQTKSSLFASCAAPAILPPSPMKVGLPSDALPLP